MILLSLALLLAFDDQQLSRTPPSAVGVTRSLTIRERVIVRVPMPRGPAASAAASGWREKKGPRCLTLDRIAGAAITGPDRVDLLFRGGTRIRAELARACPALDFYSGFYIRPGADGRICADRDSVHARSGGQCEIERFRELVPRKPGRSLTK